MASKFEFFNKSQLFLRYYYINKQIQLQHRIINVHELNQLSWTDNNCIDFNDILYITEGHLTPIFKELNNKTNENLCLSIVYKNNNNDINVLDLQAPNQEIAKKWVIGLRLSIKNIHKVLNWIP